MLCCGVLYRKASFDSEGGLGIVIDLDTGLITETETLFPVETINEGVVTLTVFVRDAASLLPLDGVSVDVNSAGGDDPAGTDYFSGTTDAAGELSDTIEVADTVNVLAGLTRPTPYPSYLAGYAAGSMVTTTHELTIHGFLSEDPSFSPFSDGRFIVADRVLKILENDRYSAIGFFLDRDGFYAANQDGDDELTYTLDYKHWLGSGETITAYTQTAENCTLSEQTATTTQVQFEVSAVSGRAAVETQVTTSTGDKFTVGLRFYEKAGA